MLHSTISETATRYTDYHTRDGKLSDAVKYIDCIVLLRKCERERLECAAVDRQRALALECLRQSHDERYQRVWNLHVRYS